MNIKIIKQNNNYYIATDNDKIVGIVSYGDAKNDFFKKVGEIYSINVLEQYQNKGIGKKLLLTSIKELINQKYEKMIVNIPYNNKNISFFEKYGGVKIITKREKEMTNNIVFFDNINDIYENNKQEKLLNKKLV